MNSRENLWPVLSVVNLRLVADWPSHQVGVDEPGLPWWIWLIVVAALGYIVWWLIVRSMESVSEDLATAEITEIDDSLGQAEGQSDVATLTDSANIGQHDLKRVEGIGPKIAAVLADDGVTTFAELAGTEADRLREILADGDIRLGDPTTWPEQARLAADGEWQRLERLQDDLKGGRRASEISGDFN